MKDLKLISISSLVFSACTLSGCVPGFLKKYTEEADLKRSGKHEERSTAQVSSESSSEGEAGGLEPVASSDSMALDDGSATAAEHLPKAGSGQAVRSGEIVNLRHNAFLFKGSTKELWEAALAVLMENYSLTIVDEKSGIIATEWDKFHLSGELHRNKLTLKISQSGAGRAEVMIKNTEEVFKLSGSESFQSEWLPLKGGEEESTRVIKNMAMVLNQHLREDSLIGLAGDPTKPRF